MSNQRLCLDFIKKNTNKTFNTENSCRKLNSNKPSIIFTPVERQYKQITILLLACMFLAVYFSDFVFKSGNNIQKQDEKYQNRIVSLVSIRDEDYMLKNSVNIHYWDNICGYAVEDLRNHPMFPHYPLRQDTIDSLNFKFTESQFGARIFGYIHPPIDGFYVFAISSDDCSEFWLSNDADPINIELLAEVGGISGNEWSYENQFDKYPRQVSMEVKLYAGKRYFFDILWKQGRARAHVQVVWKKPTDVKFKSIEKKYLSQYYDANRNFENKTVNINYLKDDFKLPDLPSHKKLFLKTHDKKINEGKILYQRDSAEFLSLSHLKFNDVSDVLTTCTYFPSWIVKTNSDKAKSLGEYEGVHLPHYYNISTRVFPRDQTWDHSSECIGESLKLMHCQGNQVENELSAQWLVSKYMTALSIKFPNRFKLHTIVNVENAHDVHGDRYLIELAVEDFHDQNKIARLSVYVFRLFNSNELCYPENFQWKNEAMVHLVLTVKNQGAWVQHYIESLSNVYTKTKDNRFNLIIVDFESFDVNVTKLLTRSILPHWQVITLSGKFQKTLAIQRAINSIKEADSIALQTDLHLEFPINFIDNTRKHCVQGKMAYSPLQMKLACGRYCHNPAGFWDIFGYEIFGIYKSDWDRTGGMNVEKFLYRDTRGGEDWDFVDRVIKNGLEIDRLRVPNLFHYAHTKKGMWDDGS
ncbi:N-acetyl-beta-glucosaminyl-glycoprotein 4-beta-N-acetylgalactosaminyltransferase 1 isoform X1 [Hydra vulgaris]|uniref:N-acetyl-beta-glucosaminyl-glycoprotein 4-beta-N-acetylgalactosaminyltransferase 1 isoform X1 n=1 Tax=Hydra vulgaris TaxID=6087 RepID=UPI001F5FDE0B|nr:N-acetyl-beta-glucosaminyl-glycoprotein 4-beta-N-acetylgalactosaminyltransferase 1 [Hydra vulgaris]